jgi:TolA-binding protein
VILAAVLSGFLAACVTPAGGPARRPGSKPGASKTKPKTKASPAKKPGTKGSAPAAPAPRAVDSQAQQKAYDLGLNHYTSEEYEEAKKAWKEVIRLGPNTPLADRARENILKTDQILGTLYKLENK